VAPKLCRASKRLHEKGTRADKRVIAKKHFVKRGWFGGLGARKDRKSAQDQASQNERTSRVWHGGRQGGRENAVARGR